jgi:hypothetical protein
LQIVKKERLKSTRRGCEAPGYMDADKEIAISLICHCRTHFERQCGIVCARQDCSQP